MMSSKLSSTSLVECFAGKGYAAMGKLFHVALMEWLQRYTGAEDTAVPKLLLTGMECLSLEMPWNRLSLFRTHRFPLCRCSSYLLGRQPDVHGCGKVRSPQCLSEGFHRNTDNIGTVSGDLVLNKSTIFGADVQPN
eukprot:5447416-Amphidinium_carterae.4